MENDYENIDNLTNQTNRLYDEQLKQQQNIVNTSTKQIIDEIERNKIKAEEEASKTNRALYADYQKQINPYGVNAENMASQGLGGSGLAETTKANYYNTYQNARTEATNNVNNIKADFDAQITKARQNGDLQLAQSALDMYKQKVQDLYNTYNLKFQQDQFNYQKQQDALSQSNWEKEYNQAVQQALWQQQFNQAQFDYSKSQDALSQSNWQKEFDYNKALNDRQYNYQLNRDQVTDSQWQKEYDLSRQSASRSSSRSSSGSKTGNSLNVGDSIEVPLNANDIALSEANNSIDRQNLLREIARKLNKSVPIDVNEGNVEKILDSMGYAIDTRR